MMFEIFLIYFGKFYLKIWPLFGLYLVFFTLSNLAFFKTAYGQIWPFYFLGPGNPDAVVEREIPVFFWTYDTFFSKLEHQL
jgi:hypothetical protein